MSNVVISVENLSKSYQLGQIGTGTLSHDLEVWWAKMCGKPNPMLKIGKKDHGNRDGETLWALKDVSFQVEQGEVLGIIGRNGAGKSTLLKILSRVTAPTSGVVKVKGRIASLLEVGTGFHPDLTGGENIYLNGAILGMSKEEVRRKFDEIVAFAEVEQFIDTPVKRYSSGMYVRLAFAVAAHLESEILLVDEVLAVGDAEFQKKCLGKMGDIASKEGRTIFFVSHNLNSIERLCRKGLLLNHGKLENESNVVSDVIKSYLNNQKSEIKYGKWINKGNEFNNLWFTPNKLQLTNLLGIEKELPIENSDPDIYLRIEANIKLFDPALTIGFSIFTETGELLFWSYQTDQTEDNWPKLHLGNNILQCNIPRNLLNEGDYRISIIGGLHNREWLFPPTMECPTILLTIRGGLSQSPLWITKRPGLIAPILRWVSLQ